jgi:hypothetical protein
LFSVYNAHYLREADRRRSGKPRRRSSSLDIGRSILENAIGPDFLSYKKRLGEFSFLSVDRNERFSREKESASPTSPERFLIPAFHLRQGYGGQVAGMTSREGITKNKQEKKICLEYSRKMERN